MIANVEDGRVEQILPFGVGCITFEWVGVSRFTGLQWGEAVEKALLAIPSIEDVHVLPGDDEDVLRDVPDGVNVAQRGGWVPNSLDASVRFTVTIPRRMHSDLHEGLGHLGEVFLVIMRYEYDAPVTFVISLDGVGSGSDGVILVREFLKREVPKRTEELRINTLGPSPFHAHFVLQETQAVDHWEVCSEARRGYDEVQYTFPANGYGSILEATDDLVDMVADEFSVFYALQLRRDRRLRDSVRLLSETARLVGLHQRRGAKGWFVRLFRSSTDARLLGVTALDFILDLEMDSEFARERIEGLYREPYLAPHREKLDQAANESFDAPARSALDVVAFLEGGRTKEFEVSVVAGATLMGAVAGAIASMIAR